jgi:hypothetical protein
MLDATTTTGVRSPKTPTTPGSQALSSASMARTMAEQLISKIHNHPATLR